MATHFDIAKLARSVGNLPPSAKGLQSGLRIGLVNNMPDGALTATEQQFSRLVSQSTNGEASLKLYYLPSLARGDAARKILDESYRPITDLYRDGIDALIVTGNEPRSARLDEEPYWPEMTRLIDWARTNTASTFWSCLAAHAAVLHLDKVERQRLPAKRSGTYICKGAGGQGALPQSLVICHSRLNDVPTAVLEKSGYSILSQSAAGDVDIFMKSMPSRFLFLQGHPEYDGLSLAREYRRDVDRFLNRVRDEYPAMPENYFDRAATELYQNFRKEAENLRLPSLIENFPAPTLRADLARELASSAAAIFAFWIDQIKEVADARANQVMRQA